LPIFRVEITPEAERDIRAIAAYIRKDNLSAAISVVSEIKEQVNALAQFPDNGKTWPYRRNGGNGSRRVAIYRHIPGWR